MTPRCDKKTLRLDQELIDAYQFERHGGCSPLMLEVYAKIRRIAPHFRTVLVTGATGTGKGARRQGSAQAKSRCPASLL